MSKRNRWIFGGNRSGKTECGAVEAVWMLRGIHPYRKNKDGVFGWVVSPTFAMSRDVAQSKILYYLNPDWIEDVVMLEGKASNPGGGVIDYILVKNVFGGVSKLGFKSSEQGRIRFQGASLDFVWFDEEPPEDIYDECRMRVLDKKGDIFGTMTPLLGLTFVYNKIFLNEGGDDQIWHIGMEWADNPYLDKDEVDALSSSLSDDALESRRYGRFINNQGLVYSEFDQRIHVIEPFNVPKEWYDNLSIDPGLNNPLSCHWYAVDGDGNVYVIAEHYEKGQTVDYHAGVIKRICDELGWHRDSFGRVGALIDSAASQRTLAAEKSVVELFLDEGIQVNPRVDKNLFSGISRVKQYLKGSVNKSVFRMKNAELRGGQNNLGQSVSTTPPQGEEEFVGHPSTTPPLCGTPPEEGNKGESVAGHQLYQSVSTTPPLCGTPPQEGNKGESVAGHQLYQSVSTTPPLCGTPPQEGNRGEFEVAFVGHATTPLLCGTPLEEGNKGELEEGNRGEFAAGHQLLPIAHCLPPTAVCSQSLPLAVCSQPLPPAHAGIYIFKNCTNLIREIKSYWWGEGDVPKKKDDHALDELRYYIMSRPESFKPTVKLSVIQKDKKRLTRELMRKRKNGG